MQLILQKYTNERKNVVILINAKEKEEISEKCPHVHIRRTMKQKSKRHRYYMEESREAMSLLRIMRGESVDTRPRRRNKR